MSMLHIEFIYRTTAASYTTSQEEYRKIFVFNFFPKSSGIRIFITFWGFRPTVRRSSSTRSASRLCLYPLFVGEVFRHEFGMSRAATRAYGEVDAVPPIIKAVEAHFRTRTPCLIVTVLPTIKTVERRRVYYWVGGNGPEPTEHCPVQPRAQSRLHYWLVRHALLWPLRLSSRPRQRPLSPARRTQVLFRRRSGTSRHVVLDRWLMIRVVTPRASSLSAGPAWRRYQPRWRRWALLPYASWLVWCGVGVPVLGLIRLFPALAVLGVHGRKSSPARGHPPPRAVSGCRMPRTPRPPSAPHHCY